MWGVDLTLQYLRSLDYLCLLVLTADESGSVHKYELAAAVMHTWFSLGNPQYPKLNQWNKTPFNQMKASVTTLFPLILNKQGCSSSSFRILRCVLDHWSLIKKKTIPSVWHILKQTYPTEGIKWENTLSVLLKSIAASQLDWGMQENPNLPLFCKQVKEECFQLRKLNMAIKNGNGTCSNRGC